jgi:ABC-type lipopolysaccharide export system ATPase subunit
MVKVNISIEGEDLPEIVEELMKLGVGLLKSNRNEIREIIKICAEEALDVLTERKILEQGAQLYKKINTEINWTYKREKP